MHCEEKIKLRLHNTGYCLVEVVTKAGLTVHNNKIKISGKCVLYLGQGYIQTEN